MLRTARCATIAVLAGTAARAAEPQDLTLALDVPDATWTRVEPVADGARGGAARFADPKARIDAGACPVSSREPFTLRASIRTTDPGFCTPLMARDGGAVGVSFVLGREPGRISFEAWSWQTVRLVSRTRIDDGRWHTIEASYDPGTNAAALFVDGRAEAVATLGPGESPRAQLRLGNNIGADQPFRGELDDVALERRTTRADVFTFAVPVVSEKRRETQLAALRERILRRTTPALDDVAAWPVRRAEVRRAVADTLGLDPPPPRAPLDVKVHGETKSDGVRVQRVSWSSWPGHRATGWLWLPDPAPAGRLPAMLGPHGHWAGGAIDPVVQARAIRFARTGYVALMVDSVHVEDAASGVSALGVMTWNNLRAIDLLLARDDVDPARIGMTGASGGAQQTMALMALDDRPAAAAPIVMACYFAEITADRSAHCTCNHVPRTAFLTDVPEMCAVFAPRPAFFGSVTGDWTRRFPREGFPELRRLWTALGAPDAVVNVHRDEGHNYDRPFREAVYAFFDARFGVTAPAAEGPVRTVSRDTLAVLGPPPMRADGPSLAREHVARRSRVTTLAALAPALPWRVSKSPLRDVARRGAWRAATVAGEDGVDVAMLVRDDAAAGPDAPWTLVVAEAGMASVGVDPPPWLARSPRAALVEPRFRGEGLAFADAWRRNGLLLGRGEGYQSAHDIALAAASLPGTGNVHVVGLGRAGVEALLAAAITERIGVVVADDVGPRWADDGNRLPMCPEILRFGDLPDVVASLRGPRRVAIGGAARPGEFRGANGVAVRATEPALDADGIGAALQPR